MLSVGVVLIALRLGPTLNHLDHKLGHFDIMSRSNSSHRWLGSFVSTIVTTVPLAIAIRDTTVSLATVRENSMSPTLTDGDVILVRRRNFWFHHNPIHDRVERNDWMQGIMAPRLTVAPGEVVVVRNPLSLDTLHGTGRLYVKRIVGVGGQWLVHPGVSQSFRLEELPTFSVFVEGDNLDDSIDSRLLGPLSRNLVVGVAEYVVWPPSRWKHIKQDDRLHGKVRAVWSRDELDAEN